MGCCEGLGRAEVPGLQPGPELGEVGNPVRVQALVEVYLQGGILSTKPERTMRVRDGPFREGMRRRPGSIRDGNGSLVFSCFHVFMVFHVLRLPGMAWLSGLGLDGAGL